MTTNPLPPPNPLWKRSEPQVSKCGRYVSIDAMVLYDLAEHNRLFKVEPAQPRSQK